MEEIHTREGRDPHKGAEVKELPKRSKKPSVTFIVTDLVAAIQNDLAEAYLQRLIIGAAGTKGKITLETSLSNRS